MLDLLPDLKGGWCLIALCQYFILTLQRSVQEADGCSQISICLSVQNGGAKAAAPFPKHYLIQRWKPWGWVAIRRANGKRYPDWSDDGGERYPSPPQGDACVRCAWVLSVV